MRFLSQADGNDALLFNELSFDPKHLYSRDPSRFFCGPCTGTGYIGQHCPPAVNGGLHFKSLRRSFGSEEHTSELKSLMRISYAVFCLEEERNRTRAKANLLQ